MSTDKNTPIRSSNLQPAPATPVANAPSTSSGSVPAFEIKPFLKKELAQLYFPDYTEAYALKKLRKWIVIDPEFNAEMQNGPETVTDQTFSRRQVEVIVKYLGQP